MEQARRAVILRRYRLAALIALAVLSGCGGSASKAPGSTASPDSTAPRAATTDSALVALGNEPFWNVRVTAREILYRDPEHQNGYHFRPVYPVAEGDARVYRTERDAPANDSGPRTLELRIRRGTCSDGMSDRQYPMMAALKVGEVAYTGCAWIQPDSSPPPPER